MDEEQSRAFGGQLKPQLAWFRWPFLLDWTVLLLLGYASQRVQRMPPFEHEIEGRLLDPSIAYKHVEHETVSVQELFNLSFWTPIVVVIALGFLRFNLAEVHSGLLSFFAGWNIMGIFLGFVKAQVGRLRPDFLDRCQYDIFKGVCTGNKWVVQEGRRSFPSGHSSAALYAAVFLVLLFAGKTRSLCFSEHGTGRLPGPWRFLEPLQSKLLRLSYTLSPLLPGLYIAISRYQDHVHHPTDILAGSALGTIFALLAYHVYWPSPFVPDNVNYMSEPRALYWHSGPSHRDGEREPLLAGDAEV